MNYFSACIGYSTNLSGLNVVVNEASTNDVLNSSMDETGSMSKSAMEMEYSINI